MYYKIINKKKRIATRATDIMGSALFAPQYIFRKKGFNPADIREILVVRTAYIGDVIMTLPVLKPLKRLYPDAKITFLTCKAAEGLLRGNPYVDSVIAYDAFWFYDTGKKGYPAFISALRAKKYDLVIEARADIRDIALIAYASGARRRVSYGVAGGGFLLTDVVPFPGIKHKVEYHLDIVRFLGGVVDEIDWCLRPSPEDYRKADELLAQKKGRFKIGILAGGRKPLKSWAAERFASLADRLAAELGADVFFAGSAQERELAEGIIKSMRCPAVNLAGKTDIMTGAALIGRADVFITNDSAPLHIASAMKTPTVAIFGPSKSNETGPYGNIHRVVEKDFPCRFTCDEDVCLHSVQKQCMDAVSVEDVFKAVKEVIKEKEGGKKDNYAI